MQCVHFDGRGIGNDVVAHGARAGRDAVMTWMSGCRGALLRAAFAVVVGLAVLCATNTVQAQTYSRIVAFGDSWTDDCCSNGPPWIETVAAQLKLPLTNRAVGGATSAGLLSQARQYAANGADPNALYVYWNLGNDFGSAAALADINGTAAKIGANLKATVDLLRAAGARHFVVLNMPFLGGAPGAAASGVTQQLANAMVNAQNAATTAALEDLGLLPSMIDAKAIVAAVIADPQFTNRTQACSLVNCSNPDRYVWWDGSHPTARVHQMIGARVADQIAAPKTTTPKPPTNLVAQ